MLQLNELTVNYGKRQSKPVLDRINMSLSSEKVVIVGPNGSGKTTLIKAILGLAPVANGSVKVFGREAINISGETRVSTNLSEVYRLMRLAVHDLIELYSEIKGSHSSGPMQMIHDFGLKGILEKKIYQLSSGEQKMLSNILALSYNPELVLLDEPFDNVDHARRLRLASMLNETRGEILLNTHEFDILSKLENWFLYFMIEGRLFGKFLVSQLKVLYLNRGDIPGNLSVIETSFGKFSITEGSGEVAISGARNLNSLLEEVTQC